MADTWPQWISSGKHVAEAADWIRWKTQNRVKIVVAIGAHSVAVAKARELDPEDALAILQDCQDTIARAMREIHIQKLTHGHKLIPPR